MTGTHRACKGACLHGGVRQREAHSLAGALQAHMRAGRHAVRSLNRQHMACLTPHRSRRASGTSSLPSRCRGIVMKRVLPASPWESKHPCVPITQRCAVNTQGARAARHGRGVEVGLENQVPGLQNGLPGRDERVVAPGAHEHAQVGLRSGSPKTGNATQREHAPWQSLPLQVRRAAEAHALTQAALQRSVPWARYLSERGRYTQGCMPRHARDMGLRAGTGRAGCMHAARAPA